MPRYTIGRHESSDIVVVNPTVSRQHAELADLGNGTYRLSDLKSTSGTHALIDGKWVDATGVEVTVDTQVGIGEHETTIGELLKLAGIEVEEPTRAPAMAKAQPAAIQPEVPPPRPAAAKAAPAPRAPAPPPAPAAKRAAGPKTPAPAGGKSNKTMWIVIGGVTLFVLVGIAAVATILLTRGGEPSTTASRGAPTTPGAPGGGDQARLVAACEKGPGSNRRFCDCLAKVVLAEFTGKDRELLIRIFEEGAWGDPVKLAQFMQGQRDLNPVEFSKKFANAMPRVQRECS